MSNERTPLSFDDLENNNAEEVDPLQDLISMQYLVSLAERINLYISDLHKNPKISEPHPTNPELVLRNFLSDQLNVKRALVPELAAIYIRNKTPERQVSIDISKLNKKLKAPKYNLLIRRPKEYEIGFYNY